MYRRGRKTGPFPPAFLYCLCWRKPWHASGRSTWVRFPSILSLTTTAKNTPYGWADENAQARTLAQFGHPVPRLAAEEVYQEILGVYCGNYWGRSAAHSILQPFLDTLDITGIRLVANLFASNSRVQSELGNSKPKGACCEPSSTTTSTAYDSKSSRGGRSCDSNGSGAMNSTSVRPAALKARRDRGTMSFRRELPVLSPKGRFPDKSLCNVEVRRMIRRFSRGPDC
jgi:hypothetical protein